MEPSLIYVKTNLGGWFFDAFLRIDHESKLTITEHPVQSGAAVNDHAYLNPRKLTMEIGMSDVAASIVSGQFVSGLPRSVTAFRLLQELQAKKTFLRVLTRLQLYENMLIESISAPDDYTTRYSLKATVSLREVIVPSVKTVAVSAAPQITGATNLGQIQPVEPNVSIIEQIRRMVAGD